MGEIKLVADALNRLIEAEARFNADDQQVERIGQRQANPVPPPVSDASEHHGGNDVANGAGTQGDGHARVEQWRCGGKEEGERHGDPDAEEDCRSPRWARYPAATSLFRSFPVSAAVRGAAAPTRFSVLENRVMHVLSPVSSVG